MLSQGHGVLVMVAKHLCSSQDISHSTLVDGRILHLRVKLPEHGLNLLNVYQHPWRAADTYDNNVKNREKIWQCLHSTLEKVPFRNQLLIAGDFNSSLIKDNHADDTSFRQLLKHHHLGSILQSNPAQLTFFSPQGNSQIDYVFSRGVSQLDARAKEGWVEKLSQNLETLET